MEDLTVNLIHATIDSHGVRQKAKASAIAKSSAINVAEDLSNTKRGNTEIYRIAILAMIAALFGSGKVTDDGSIKGRKSHIANGGSAFSISVLQLFGVPDSKGNLVLPDSCNNDGAALGTWINRNVNRFGVDKSKVVTLRDEEHKDMFWVMIRK